MNRAPLPPHLAIVGVAVVLAGLSGLWAVACVHDDGISAEQRLEAARIEVQGRRRDTASAIAWSDAVAEALNASIFVDEGDVTDAMNRLRAAQAAAFGADAEPVAAARARLLTAAGRQDEADAAWVEAARAAPTPRNLEALFKIAERANDRTRLRALCAVGPVALAAHELNGWLERCAGPAGLDKAAASALWLATDRTRLQSGTEPGVTTPRDHCLQRCRPAFYRAVAGCPVSDDRCLGLASQTFDVCETNCHEMQ